METKLKDQISVDVKSAMKSRDKLTLDVLRVLMNEVYLNQASTDEDVQKEVKKMINNLEQTPSDTSQKEIDVLEKYMPAQLTEGDMIFKVAELVKENNYTSMKDMRSVMNYFNENFPNQFDGKKLSIITKNQLNA